MTTSAIAISITEILANEIVFHSREEISVYGFRESNGSFVECEFVIGRQHLQILLSQNGKTGVEILWHIEQMFIHAHSCPAEIILLNLFGMTQPLKAAAIQLEMGEYEDAKVGDREVWFVQSVAAIPGIKDLAKV